MSLTAVLTMLEPWKFVHGLNLVLSTTLLKQLSSKMALKGAYTQGGLIFQAKTVFGL